MEFSELEQDMLKHAERWSSRRKYVSQKLRMLLTSTFLVSLIYLMVVVIGMTLGKNWLIISKENAYAFFCFLVMLLYLTDFNNHYILINKLNQCVYELESRE